MSEAPYIPVRLCCGQAHLGVQCPDGKVMCCMCFERFDLADLNTTPTGQKEDCCKRCGDEERTAIEQAQKNV